MLQAKDNIKKTIAHLKSNQKTLEHRIAQCDIDKAAFQQQLIQEEQFLTEMEAVLYLINKTQ